MHASSLGGPNDVVPRPHSKLPPIVFLLTVIRSPVVGVMDANLSTLGTSGEGGVLGETADLFFVFIRLVCVIIRACEIFD